MTQKPPELPRLDRSGAIDADGKKAKMARNNFAASTSVIVGGIEFQRESTGLAYLDNSSFGLAENLERVFLYRAWARSGNPSVKT